MGTVYPLEVSMHMNSRNSSDLGSSSTSRSTFLHTTFPQRSWIPTSHSPDVSFPQPRRPDRVASLLQRCSAADVLQERGTDGGWACNDEAEHFSLIPELEPRSAWMSQHCQQVRTNLNSGNNYYMQSVFLSN